MEERVQIAVLFLIMLEILCKQVNHVTLALGKVPNTQSTHTHTVHTEAIHIHGHVKIVFIALCTFPVHNVANVYSAPHSHLC